MRPRPRDNYPIVVSRLFPARPGHAYRLKATMKATHPDAKAGLMLQGYEANAYFWANSPTRSSWEPTGPIPSSSSGFLDPASTAITSGWGSFAPDRLPRSQRSPVGAHRLGA